ncbi:MAG: ATP-binding cassette domain-containing protein [Actinomycetota bacterium]
MTSIETNGLTKDFGELRAVDDISMTLPDGGVIGLIGPNGAGKSTMIRMLLGLVAPSSGDAEVLGQSIRNPSAYLARVGALIEAPAFHPSLTGEENLRLLATLGGHPRRRISGVIETVGLTGRERDRYRQYSLGMKQRLGIAAALLPDPDLLVLDEPTNGLDPEGIVEIRQLISDLGADGKTVLVSSHLLSEIQAACEWIVMIDRGAMVFSGPLDDLLGIAQPTIRAAAEDQYRHHDLIQIAEGAGFHAVLSNDGVEIEAPATWAADLNRLAWHAGINLRELQVVANDLEGAFFAMTGTGSKGVDR